MKPEIGSPHLANDPREDETSGRVSLVAEFQPVIRRGPMPGKPFALDLSLEGFAPKHVKQTARSYKSDREYQVDLIEQTCTCPDFSELRSKARANSMPRLCKHLMMKLHGSGAFKGENEWLRAIADQPYGGPKEAWLVERADSPPALVTRSGDGVWLNVYARSKRKGERISEASGAIKSYGWNTVDRRWAYGEAPPGARELRAILEKMI